MHTFRILLNRVFWRSFFLLRSFCNHGIQSGGFVNRKLVSSDFGNRGLGSRAFVSRNFIRWGFGRDRGIFCSCLRRFDQDFSADGILDDVHLLVFHEFEENEEGHDDLFLALLGFQKGAEFGPGVCLQISADIESLGIDVDFFAPDFSEPAPDRITSALFSAEDFSEDFFQLFQVSALEEILIVNRRLVGSHFFGKVLRTKITHACLLPADSELFGHIFIHLVFQKSADQLLAGIAFFFAGGIVSLFHISPEGSAAAIEVVRLYSVVSVTLWVFSFGLPNTLRAAGDTKFTMTVSVISMLTLRLGLSYILVDGLGLGLNGVWYAMYADWAVRSLCFFIRFRSRKWLDRRVI